MAHYHILEHSDVLSILSEYDLGNNRLAQITPMSDGITNTNYKIDLESNESYVLKICHDKSFEQYEKEINLLDAIKELSFVPSPLEKKTQDRFNHSRTIFEFKGLFGAIFPYYKNNTYRPSAKHLCQTAKALKDLHKLKLNNETLSKLRLYKEVGHDLEFFKKIIKDADSRLPEDFLQSWSEVFDDEALLSLESLFQKSPISVIHGDLFFDNVLYHHDRLVSFIDFEQAGLGPTFLDLGITQVGHCFVSSDDEEARARCDFFLSQYGEDQGLTQRENYLCVLFGFFSIAFWRIERFYFKGLNPDLKWSYLDLLKSAKNFKKSF